MRAYFISLLVRKGTRSNSCSNVSIYLADGLSDGVNLAGLTTTAYTNADVDIGELVQANNQERLVDLESKDGRLNEAQRLS